MVLHAKKQPSIQPANNNGDDNMHLSNPRIFRTECQLFMWITMSLCCVCMLSLVVLYWHTQIYTILILKSTNLKGIEFLLSSKTRWIHNRGSSSIFKTRPKAVLIYMAWHGMLCYAVWFTLLKSILMQCDDDGYMTRPWFSLFCTCNSPSIYFLFFHAEQQKKENGMWVCVGGKMKQQSTAAIRIKATKQIDMKNAGFEIKRIMLLEGGGLVLTLCQKQHIKRTNRNSTDRHSSIAPPARLCKHKNRIEFFHFLLLLFGYCYCCCILVY